VSPSVITYRQTSRKAQQVEIEARVVSASRSFSRDIGTQLAIAGQGWADAILAVATRPRVESNQSERNRRRVSSPGSETGHTTPGSGAQPLVTNLRGSAEKEESS